MIDKFSIRRLATGVPGLDALLGGGLPEFSFNLIAGEPGSGKTTLAQQIMFSLAAPTRKALFFTVLGEPPLKMLRYQQQFSFFDAAKVGDSVHFIDLSEDLLQRDFDRVLRRVIEEVERHTPGLVFVDSFRSIMTVSQHIEGGTFALQQFVEELAVQLTSWQATTFLLGEYSGPEKDSGPVATIVDGILWLMQSVHRNSMVRKMQVAKMRGQGQIAGLHTFRIGGDGVQVFPRTIIEPRPLSGEAPAPPDAAPVPPDAAPVQRISMGVPNLDEMLGGGLPSGYSLLVVGPSGAGKTVLASEFLAEGARRGEPGVIAAFEKGPPGGRSSLGDLVSAGKVGVIDTRALDLSVDESLYALTEMIQRMGAKRVVIDSLAGFELALAPSFREDFRESLYRMVVALTNLGTTVLMTAELEDRYGDLRFSPYGSAFLTDAIIVQRYVELKGELQRVIGVVKVRNSAHSIELRRYEITGSGIDIGAPFDRYDGLLTGSPSTTTR